MFRAKRTTIKFTVIVIITVALFERHSKSAVVEAAVTTYPSSSWVSIKSEHFTLVGQVGARRLQSLALNLERFRAVFSQILPARHFDAYPPTVVVVFAGDEEYTPFKPLRPPPHGGTIDRHVAGYFRAGVHLNYITLAAQETDQKTTSVLFHEYVHSLAKRNQVRLPLWFNEGLAEYYSAYDLAGARRQQLRVGQAIPYRVQTLRTHTLLPLSSVLRADWSSSVYHEPDRREIFYAQSWALVHYLMSDPTGARQRQLTKFLMLSAEAERDDATSVDDHVRRSFQIEPATLERKLADYVRVGRYVTQVKILPEAPQVIDAAMPAAVPLHEAEAGARLGDLLFRLERFDEARAYLEAALAKDPNLAAARLSLALLDTSQGNEVDARKQLGLVMKSEPTNYLAHYLYADSLRRDTSDAVNTPAGFVARTAQIKAELNRAIELAPDFLDAKGLLVLTDIERSPGLGEATELLRRMMTESPGRREFKLLLARLLTRKQQYGDARLQLLEVINDSQTDEFLRAAARGTLGDTEQREKLAGARKADDEEELTLSPGGEWQPCDMPEPGPQLKARRFTGTQLCGRLEKVECGDAEAVVVSIKVGDRTLRLHSAALGRVKFVSYMSRVKGRIGCGEPTQNQSVLVTYRPAGADAAQFDGELRAVEFLPEEWFAPK